MRLYLLLSLLLFSLSASAQRYSRVKINLDASHTIGDLAKMGLDVDHGRYQPGKYFTGEFADYEIAQIKAEGYVTQVLVEDLQAHLLTLNESGEVEPRSLPPCPKENGPIVYDTPVNYTYGSMGGYHTYQEMLDLLDTMAVKYPDIFKKKVPTSSVQTTHEGRPVYWVKISDNPDIDEPDEPELLYTAVHHAREPNSMSQLIFYLWFLLENYESDEEVKYLVDNTEMYFVPCVNPDGYIYNESTNPDGGGFWRKNRRDNLDGTFGVDLNRNYGYEWGHDNSGSSPNPDAQTYRGPLPSSEPETQMMQDFCLAHQFQIALNYHTYSNLLIFPWGYSDSFTNDHSTFSTFGQLLTQDNNYKTGLATQTVGYNVNGTSDDWMYGVTKIYSMTPEVGPGSSGFWPPQNAIDGLNKDAMRMNITAAQLVLNYGELKHSGGQYISKKQGQIDFSIEKVGLAAGGLTVSLEPKSANIASTGSPKTYGLFHMEEVSSAIAYNLKPSVQDGDTVLFDLVMDNGLYTWRQSLTKIYTTQAQTGLFETGGDLSQWSVFGDWAATTQTWYSAPSSITDSPGGNYLPNNLSEITLKDAVTVKDATAVYLSFWAKWDIEEDEDYTQVLVSVNGINYIPLCGKYTEAGTAEQDLNEPVYDGIQQLWVKEEINLSEYLDLADSVEFKIAFRLRADDLVESDGFYFDDLALTVVKEGGLTATTVLDASKFTLSSRPNPAGDYVVIDMTGEIGPSNDLKLHIFNTFGQEMKTEAVQGKTMLIDTKEWQQGIYYYRLSQDGQQLPGKRFVIAR